jgi:hypothetical protein
METVISDSFIHFGFMYKHAQNVKLHDSLNYVNKTIVFFVI